MDMPCFLNVIQGGRKNSWLYGLVRYEAGYLNMPLIFGDVGHSEHYMQVARGSPFGGVIQLTVDNKANVQRRRSCFYFVLNFCLNMQSNRP